MAMVTSCLLEKKDSSLQGKKNHTTNFQALYVFVLSVKLPLIPGVEPGFPTLNETQRRAPDVFYRSANLILL